MDKTFFEKQTYHVEKEFKKWFESTNTNNRTKFCELLDNILAINQNLENSETLHNCIGCNIEDGCKIFMSFAKRFKNYDNINSYLPIYSLFLYSLAERVIVPYQKITNPNANFNWKSTTPTFYKIKLWANLFKHPKSSMFLHHPIYSLQNDPNRANFNIDLIIDDQFLDDYFKNESKNQDLENLITERFVGISIKHKNVQILFPDIVQLTKNFCAEIDIFFELANQPLNLNKLNEYTIDNY